MAQDDDADRVRKEAEDAAKRAFKEGVQELKAKLEEADRTNPLVHAGFEIIRAKVRNGSVNPQDLWRIGYELWKSDK